MFMHFLYWTHIHALQVKKKLPTLPGNPQAGRQVVRSSAAVEYCCSPAPSCTAAYAWPASTQGALKQRCGRISKHTCLAVFLEFILFGDYRWRAWWAGVSFFLSMRAYLRGFLILLSSTTELSGDKLDAELSDRVDTSSSMAHFHMHSLEPQNAWLW